MNPELYRAASSGDLSLFERLANSETLVDVTIEKSIVLHIAVQCNHPQVAQKVVQLRPSLLYQTNSKGNTPLQWRSQEFRLGGGKIKRQDWK